MPGQILRLAAAVLLAAAATGSMLISGYLARLEAGIAQDVTAVERVVEAQEAIRRQNEVLTDMVAVAERIDKGMGNLLEQSKIIEAQVKTVGEANRTTLALNGTLEANNGAAAEHLAQVAASLAAMNQSAQAINAHLEALRQTVSADVEYLEAIQASTARMNTKTPGF